MYQYGFWPIVIVNSLVFIIFAFSFTRPRHVRDWRMFGAFSAFIVALFTEMYGFPLTIYLLSGWFGSTFPQLSFSHNAGHLWYTLLGMTGDPHNNPVHDISNLLIFGGLVFLSYTWRHLYRAQKEGIVAKTGPYSEIRHPQYVTFIAILLGFLLQWPTIPTMIMFPILVVMYIRLARLEEKEAIEYFGDEYIRYAEATPGFIPSFSNNAKKMGR